jgi:2'-5' RNA ligase
MMEDKLRSFIAIELDPEIKAVINRFENEIKPKAPSGLRWVKPDQLHLTLKFLGDITLMQVDSLSGAISRVAAENHTFTLQVRGTGAFPNWRKPRTLWVGINQSDDLTSLFRQLDTEIGTLGFSPEGKPYSPHLTLCRVSDYVDPLMVIPLQKAFDVFAATSLPAWRVNEVVFFKSRLQPGGPVYTPISKHGLK